MSLDHHNELVKPQSPTRDAFLGGILTLLQPKDGFRAGLDSVILGASIRPGTANILDLGAGVGTAGLVALAHEPAARALLVERDPAMVALAAENIRENGLAARARVIALDLMRSAAEREAAGLARESAESVILNPPFYDTARDQAPSPARAGARQMDQATLEDWLRVATAHAAPDGEVIVIHVAEALPAILKAAENRLGALTVLPLLPRAGEATRRVLVRGRKGSRAPFTLLAGRVLHGTDGRGFEPEFEAIFKGRDRLHW